MNTFQLNDGHKIPQTGFGVFMVEPNGPTEQVVLMALKAGYRMIDTAAAYFNEEDVGRAIRKSGIPRDEIYVTSKLWMQDYGYAAAKAGIDTSLKKLGLDYMDLYLLHQPYKDTAGAWKAMEEAVKAGKIRSIGISNHSLAFLKKLLPQMEILPAVNQMECNPFCQQKELRRLLNQYGIRLEAWYPLGHGNAELLQNEVLRGIAEKYQKSVGQVILRWHLQEGIVALPKSTSEAHIRENLQLYDFSLTDAEMAEIRGLDQGHGTHNPDDMNNEKILERYNVH
ncbi:MAG: aldo/keto reductase [Selenomonas sp.]|uniref:aldo/keto reductase n=1 Tax=Selenomonas sp. TaxID=2053611 RepID=UPI0025CF08CC|nr:aldo/keto reductase [Selenomonas sp.]MCR5757854.1 aldo/keto reductase [Selenomonas sp.]